ncbi:MAG TPA: hypothetical protein VFI90_08230 [Rubrobacter sp.]|nr:hypothetical protein [Rubrobacter sp.]
MALEKRNRGANGLLWAGLAMLGTALILALVGSFYAGRGALYPGSGEMMGQGYGGPGWAARGDVATLSDARTAVERAVGSYGNPDLKVTEMMEFANNYYAEVREKDTGIGAMELLVDKNSGQVYPEPGPNMMWNAKYGMMSGGRGMGGMMGPSAQGNAGNKMPVNPEQAREIADDYLSRVSPGTQAGEAETFYGYYTLHTERGGKITGMLSVNGYSGEVWYHSWHGPFVAMDEG